MTDESALERERRLSYEAARAAVAFGEAHPDDDELDLSSYTQGYRDALAAEVPRVAELEALPELYIGNGLAGGDIEWSCWACEQPKGYPHDDDCPGVEVARAARALAPSD